MVSVEQKSLDGNDSETASQKRFLEMLLSGDRIGCFDFVQNYVHDEDSLKELYEKVLKTSLYEVGKLWEHNRITVATEHLASAIVESILNKFYSDIVSRKRVENTVVVACVENELHQIGAKMISDVFEMNGWNSFFLGANMPAVELVEYVRNIRPDILAISLSLYFHLPDLEKLIRMINREIPDQRILVGGQAFTHGGIDAVNQYQNVVYKADLSETESYIRQWAA